MLQFKRYIGIDYSGAETPESSCKGLRVYVAEGTGTPVQVAQIDKSSGATSNAVTMTGVEQPNYWAFSFWGGDFYLYTCNSDPSRTTNVTHYSPATGTIDTSYMTNIGFRIVGAGVSTCAPTVQPVEH